MTDARRTDRDRPRDLARETLQRARDHSILQWGAALAFYATVSLAPLVLILLSLVGPIVGSSALQYEIERHAAELLGPGGVELVGAIFTGIRDAPGGVPRGAALVALLGGATLFFVQLQTALNHIWNAAPRRHFWRFVRRRANALGLTAILALLLAASILASDVASGAMEFLDVTPGASLRRLVSLSWLGSIVLFALLVAVVYKALPDVRVTWRDAAVGVTTTTLFFVIGRFVSRVYLIRAGASSIYGAAGSLIVLLFWLYYSAVSALLAAEFTAVWAQARGRPLQPKPRSRRAAAD